MDKFERTLRAGRLTVWPSFEDCWIAGFLSDGKPCFFVGGPIIKDDKIYGSYWEAVAAVVWGLGNERLKKAMRLPPRKGMKVIRLPQYDVDAPDYVLELQGASQPHFFAVGRKGPLGRMFSTAERAGRAAQTTSLKEGPATSMDSASALFAKPTS